MKLIKYKRDGAEYWDTISTERAGIDEMVEVFRGGAVLCNYNLTEIRKNAEVK